MEEEEINYASVVFKTKTNSQPRAQKEEEIVYDEVKVVQKKAEQAADAQEEEEIVYDEVKVVQKEPEQAEQEADTNGLLPDQKATTKYRHYQLACCLLIFCVILLFGTIAVSVYFSLFYNEKNVRELKQLKENLTALLEDNRNLKDCNNDRNNKLSSENERLRGDNDNQTVIILNLTQEYKVSELKIANLTDDNNKLTMDNKQLKTQNQQLEKEKNFLTEQIRNIANNVTVVHQIFDAYCPKKENGNRQCEPCLDGWEYYESSCYVIHNADTAGQKTWEEAQENCRGKNSDLAVIVNEDEKKFINDTSWNTPRLTGYWIGLRVEDRKWKWINGSDLAEKSWITGPATNSYCAMSVHNQGWKSESCRTKNGWICKNAALSVETVRSLT